MSGLNEMNIKMEKIKEKAGGVAKQVNHSLLQLNALPKSKFILSVWPSSGVSISGLY